MAQDSPVAKAVKIRSFWLIYVQENKSVFATRSLINNSRQRRHSPVAGFDSSSYISYFSQLNRIENFAHLQGKFHGHFYNSGAFTQPQHIRTTRAKCLMAELEVHANTEGRRVMVAQRLSIACFIKTRVRTLVSNPLTKLQKIYAALRQATSKGVLEAFVCSSNVTHSSLICLVHRAVQSEANQSSTLGKECTSSAYKALETHREWMSLVNELDDHFVESDVNMHIYAWLMINKFLVFL